MTQIIVVAVKSLSCSKHPALIVRGQEAAEQMELRGLVACVDVHDKC